MGFLDAMKGANMNLGTVNSPDFKVCYLALKGDHFMITGAQAGTYEFEKRDVAEFKVIAAGGDWINYKMKFNDGKIAIIHSLVVTGATKNGSTSRGSGLTMAPIETYFGDLL